MVRAVFEDRDGHIWLGTAVGVSRYDGALWQHFTPADGLPHGSVWTLAQDRVGRVWMGSSQSGAASFDGTVWRAHGIDEGLPHVVHCVNRGMSTRESSLRTRPDVSGSVP